MNKKNILKDSIKLKNILLGGVVIGLVIYNIFPEGRELACWIMGAGFALGSYLHFSIKKQMTMVHEAFLIEQRENEAVIDLGGKHYVFPLFNNCWRKNNDNGITISFAVIASESRPS